MPTHRLKGSYVLALDLAGDTRLTVGRLGTFEFPAGRYLYFGSALNGLEGRVRRHLRRDKKLHWHVDYLSAAANIAEVWWAESGERLECRWAAAALKEGGEAIARGFGSSDCRCATHLLYIGSAERLDLVREALPVNEPGRQPGIYRVGTKEDSPIFEIRELVGTSENPFPCSS